MLLTETFLCDIPSKTKPRSAIAVAGLVLPHTKTTAYANA